MNSVSLVEISTTLTVLQNLKYNDVIFSGGITFLLPK